MTFRQQFLSRCVTEFFSLINNIQRNILLRDLHVHRLKGDQTEQLDLDERLLLLEESNLNATSVVMTNRDNIILNNRTGAARDLNIFSMFSQARLTCIQAPFITT